MRPQAAGGRGRKKGPALRGARRGLHPRPRIRTRTEPEAGVPPAVVLPGLPPARQPGESHAARTNSEGRARSRGSPKRADPVRPVEGFTDRETRPDSPLEAELGLVSAQAAAE